MDRKAELDEVRALLRRRRRAHGGGGDFLSQEAVDELLAGILGPDEGGGRDVLEDGPRAYEFGRQERLVRGRLPGLELLHERFARLLRRGFFEAFHRSVEISIGPVRVHRYSDFVRNLVVPTNLNVMRNFGDVEGAGLVVLDPNLVFLVVDNVFGGDGRFHTRVEGRDFSPTEALVIGEVLEEVCRAHRKAADKHGLSWGMERVRSEMNTQFVGICAPSETVLSTSFTIEISGNSAELHLMTPYSGVEGILPELRSGLLSEEEATVGEQRRLALEGCNARVVVAAEPDGLGLANLAGLAVGDVLELPDEVAVLACAWDPGDGERGLRLPASVEVARGRVGSSSGVEITVVFGDREGSNG